MVVCGVAGGWPGNLLVEWAGAGQVASTARGGDWRGGEGAVSTSRPELSRTPVRPPVTTNCMTEPGLTSVKLL